MDKRSIFHKGVLIMGCAGILAVSACKSTHGPAFNDQVKKSLAPYYEGEELSKKKDYAGAKEKFEASLKISPRPKAYYRLAQIAVIQNDINGANQYLDESLRLSPNFTDAVRLKEQIASVKGVSGDRSNPGVESVSQGEIVSATPEAHVLKTVPTQTAPAAVKMEPKVAASIESVSAPVAAAVPDPELNENCKTLMEQAKKADSEAKWKDAADLYGKIIKESPKHSVAHYNYGYSLYQMGELESAVNAYKKAVEINPGLAEAYNDLGVALENLGRSAEAERTYEKAIALGYKGDASFNLALLKEKQGDYKTSITLYEKYLQYDSNSAYASYARERITNLQRKVN